MKSLIVILVSVPMFLFGCDNNNESTPLVGTWITDTCEQASNGNEVLVDVWVNGIYEFTGQGEILLGSEIYTDSNCVNRQFPQSSSATEFGATYVDLGTQLLQEGIEGSGLSIKIEFGNQSLEIDAFYTIDNNILCFSDAFTFEALAFGISEIGSDAIDFSSCLKKP